MKPKFNYYLDLISKVVSIFAAVIPACIFLYTKINPPNAEINTEELKLYTIYFLIICAGILGIVNYLIIRRFNDQDTKQLTNDFKILSSRLSKAISNIHKKKQSYLTKLHNAKTSGEIKIIQSSLLETYERLFCTPSIRIVNQVRDILIDYSKRKFGTNQNFRIVIKLIKKDLNNSPEEYEFFNAIWDEYTWNEQIKYFKKSDIKYHKVNSNSAIFDLTTKKNKIFICNNLIECGAYRNHNEKWDTIYNAKILTKIENFSENILYGFFSIDCPNLENDEIFGDDKNTTIPLNIAFCVSEMLSIILAQSDDFYTDICNAIEERKRSIIEKNRRESDIINSKKIEVADSPETEDIGDNDE